MGDVISAIILLLMFGPYFLSLMAEDLIELRHRRQLQEDQ
jgi:hypothetical protein